MARNYYQDTYFNEETQTTDPSASSLPTTFSDDGKIKYQSSLSQRMSYSRFIYTRLFMATQLRQGPAIRPMFFDFSDDEKTFDVDSTSFMLGNSVKVSPILTKGVQAGDKFKSYFPKGDWVDLNYFGNVIKSDSGVMADLVASSTDTALHIAPNAVVPYQHIGLMNVQTTRDMETQLMTQYIINRDRLKTITEGFVYFDDGISQDSISKNNFNLWKITMNADVNQVTFALADNGGNADYIPPNYKAHLIEKVILVNADDLKDTKVACYYTSLETPVAIPIKYEYNEYFLTLTLNLPAEGVAINTIKYIRFGSATEADKACPKAPSQ